MRYTFEIEETIARQISIEGDTLDEALRELYSRYENEEIMLTKDNFVGGKIYLIPNKSSSCKILKWGEPLTDEDGLVIMIDQW